MNWKAYLKSQGYTDAEITSMETSFGAEKLAKAFESPIREKEAALAAAAQAKADKDEFERFYQEEVTPKISSVYQDAINARTELAAAKARLASATEYGFLNEPGTGTTPGNIPGVPAGQPVAAPNPVPGSPGAPAGLSALDPRYVQADKFASAVDSIPDMLGRLTKMSNEHFALFGSPLLDVDTLITTAKKEKKNVIEVWERQYKVGEKRAEIETRKREDHDRTVGEEAVRKYLTDHGQPFTAPGRTSVAAHFTPSSSDDARKPWKGAQARQQERKQKLAAEFAARSSTGTSTQKVQ